MKIAVPTNNMSTISAHFGRSKGFMVYNLLDHKITFNQYAINTFTRHAIGEYEDHDEDNHNHDRIFSAIGKCQVVLTGGISKHLYDEFNQKGIEVFVTPERNIVKALELYVNGILDHNEEACCNHIL